MADAAKISRRSFGAGMAGLGAWATLPAATAQAAPSAPSAPAGAPSWAQRARASYEALQAHLYLRTSGLYEESDPTQSGENPYSFVWPLREATAATQDVMELPGSHHIDTDDVMRRFEALERYYAPTRHAYDSYPPAPLGTSGDPFFDDNGVIGLEQIRRYRLAGDARMLQRARRTFAFVRTAWDPRGGMHWVLADWNPYQGATNVTGIASELAAHLYEETHEPGYLDWAHRTYQWVRTTMRSGTGLYANGLRLDGTVEPTLWTYNSGFMIGAATLLGRSTGDASWIRRAEDDAAGALRYWVTGARLYDQPVAFNAIFLANLLLLASQSRSSLKTTLSGFEDYADTVWRANRDPRTGLFRFQASGGGPADATRRPQTLDQSAVVQLFSLLAWTRHLYADAT